MPVRYFKFFTMQHGSSMNHSARRRLQYIVVSLISLLPGCDAGMSSGNRTMSGCHVFITWTQEEPRPQLLHVVIVPPGHGTLIHSSNAIDEYRGLEPSRIPPGLRLTPDTIYVDGFGTTIGPGARVFVMTRSRKLIVVPLTGKELASVRQPGFEQLSWLPA
jgi:hypothetical protein